MINYEMLNQNLSETENIIASKYHFRFLSLECDDIRKADIMMSIIQARVIAEGICRFIVLNEHIVKDEKNIRTATLKVYIDDLLRPNLIVPKPVISNLTTIQGISNLTVHFQVDGHLDLKEAYICLESLESTLDWFVKKYSVCGGKYNKWKISCDMLNKSGSIPPKAEGCIVSRDNEVSEIRNIITKDKVLIIKGYAGIGKTELVKDYVKKYHKRYDGIYYAENIDEVDDYIYELPIGIMNEDIKTKEEIVKEKLEVVHSMDLSYLFILDNYTGNIAETNCMLPNQYDKFHVIILVGEDYDIGSDMNCMKLNSFTLSDSLRIFKYFCDVQFDDNAIMNLLEHLSYNPRAIKMSAIFLKDNTSYNPYELVKSIKKDNSVKNITHNLYMVLTELTILEKDENTKLIAECLSLLPYNGVSKDRFIDLICGATRREKDERQVVASLNELKNSGWINVDNMEIVTMNPLLSDTIYEKIRPDMTSDTIVNFISPILKPVREIRELFLSQIIALEPFVEHIAKRVENAEKCDLTILNDIREYYIAVYNVPKINKITELMDKEINRYTVYNNNIAENAIYRQGISRFNLEDFSNAHSDFSRALDMLYDKKRNIEKIIAKISAYEGSSLAALGRNENAIKCIHNSISIREKLGKSGDKDELRALWISHYNYAKILLEIGMGEDANREIDISTNIYKKFYPEEYMNRKSINVSSLFQLKGRILSELGEYDEAINLLEDAKTIREKLKGDTYFSTAQIYSYLIDVYSKVRDYNHALQYAQQYYNVLVIQYKTDDIKAKIKETEEKISKYKENLKDVGI